MNQFVISGPTQSGKTAFINDALKSKNVINVSALSIVNHPENITQFILKHSINTNDEFKNNNSMTLVIDELNYGAISTSQMQHLINKVLTTVNMLNFAYTNNDTECPAIDSIVWCGTRMTLVQLVTNSLMYNLMNKEFPLNNINIQATNSINDQSKPVTEQDDYKTFNIYKIDTQR